MKHFFLAEVTPSYILQTEEIAEGKWMPLKNLMEHVTFPEEETLYKTVIDTLENHESTPPS